MSREQKEIGLKDPQCMRINESNISKDREMAYDYGEEADGQRERKIEAVIGDARNVCGVR